MTRKGSHVFGRYSVEPNGSGFHINVSGSQVSWSLDVSWGEVSPGPSMSSGSANRTCMEDIVIAQKGRSLAPYAQKGRHTSRTKEKTPRRQSQAWELARTAAKLLREKFGATRVAVFGALFERLKAGHSADIELAAWVIPEKQYLSAAETVARVLAQN